MSVVVAESINNTLNIIGVVSSNPKVAIAILLQFVMGLLLGYYMARVVKYVVALVIVVVAGALLNAWSIGGSIEDILRKYGTALLQYKDVLLSLLKGLGLLTAGPLAAGFFIGLIVGWARK